ncbi:uncharacterized protein LOC129716725 [Wyeomyia smithii]|uniref:uncharacterized protein LOC129716725 n=1 Tax=Wyeomyia smithii TaxID=174621 RepID=UPI002467B833|nr:uncharacterized protein LOC129716725 [Wyeomyia smithii]
MDKLLRERKSLDARLNRVSLNYEQLRKNADLDEIDIQTELDNLLEIWKLYLSVHKRMVDCSSDEEMNEVLEHQSVFKGQFSTLKSSLLKLRKRFDFSSTRHDAALSQDNGDAIRILAEQQAEFMRLISSNLNTSVNVSQPSAVPVQNIVPHTDIKLPRMNLPTFSGEILEWPSFFDLFDSAVHKNATLHDSQKLYFLKTNLVGEAAALLSHLRIEDANYRPALEKLKERYNKPLEIAAHHIHRFLSQQPMTSPSAAGLRTLHVSDVSDEVIRALKAMNQEGRDVWLLYILTEKLDPETKQLWCRKRSELRDEGITLENFLKFVDAQSGALKIVTAFRPRKPMYSMPNKTFSRSPTTLVATGQQSLSSVCVFCTKSPHQLYQCGKTFVRIALSSIMENPANPATAEYVISHITLAYTTLCNYQDRQCKVVPLMP